VSKFQELMEKKYQSHVVRTYSLSDIVMDVNKTLGGSNGYSLPESSTAVVQLLSLFNNSNPDKRRRIVSDDYSQSHITIQLLNASSKEYNELFEDLETDLEKAMEPLRSNYPEMEYGVTGTYALMLQMGEVVSKSQYRSLALAVIVISAILLITLGSVSGGILSIIPNILPTVSAFGLMGLLGIPLDTDTLMIAPLIIGIAVDDTIHFVTHYRMNLSRGNSVGEALKHTIDEVGRAVTFTTLILGVSFLLLGFSDYIGIARVGIFGSFAIFVALICDLLFLPALVHVFQPKFGVNKQNNLSVGS
jgi:predicted RND superfamily exporter protein